MAEVITKTVPEKINPIRDQSKYTFAFALSYVRNGLSIIPIKGNHYSKGTNLDERLKDSKAPLIPWTKYQTGRPTPEEITEWFKKWPKANIAIVTGKVSGIVVVDFDSDEAIAWARSKGILETAQVATNRGLHAYYKYPETGHIRNSVKINNMAIDIRSDGGYVIAPPSLHLAGFPYKWERPFHEIAPLPEIFIDIVGDKKGSVDLKPLYSGAKKGSRNDTLARLCGSWVNDGLNYEECLEMAETWNQKNNPPLPKEEIERTIKSIIRKHLLNDNTKQTFYHEKNLLRFPLFTYSKNKIHKPGMINLVVIENQKLKREWSVTSYRGLPGPFDEAVFMAINKIISERPKPVSNPINIGSLRNIAETIGHDISGRTIKNIREAIQRLHDLRITSNMTYYDANRKKYVIDCFGLFERVIFTGEMLDNDEKSKTTYIWLNSVYLKNINAGYLSQINFEIYLSLKGYIAKGLYRFLAPIIPMAKGLPIKFSYDRLADKLQIEKETQLFEIKKQLKDAHNELLKKGIFKKIFFFEKGTSFIINYQL